MIYIIKKKIRKFSLWLENITTEWIVPADVYKDLSQKKFEKAEEILNKKEFYGNPEYAKLSATMQRIKVIGR